MDIQCIRIPHVTVADLDDLTEMTHFHTEVQVMLPAPDGFANGARFVIHPTNSCILSHWNKNLQHQDDNYIMN